MSKGPSCGEHISRTLRDKPDPDAVALAHGSCACGGIKWQAYARTLSSSNCYCSICRKLSGSPFITFFSVPIDRVQFEPAFGGPRLKHFASSEFAERAFCGDCGSTLTMSYHAVRDRIWLAAGTMDSDASVRDTFYAGPVRHIYCQKVPYWHRMADDGLPQEQTMDTEETYLSKDAVKS